MGRSPRASRIPPAPITGSNTLNGCLDLLTMAVDALLDELYNQLHCPPTVDHHTRPWRSPAQT
jgi:hypothetical protein